jgi:hypothetical protein
MKKISGVLLLAGTVVGAVSACSNPPPPAVLRASCGVTVVDAATGISVVMWQSQDSGKAIYVHTVTADWYGTDVAVKVNRRVSWLPDNGYVEVDQPLPPSLYDNPTSKGCKVLSWR